MIGRADWLGGVSQAWPEAFRSADGRYLAAVVIVYVALYGALLIYSDFLPYVMDNNESFSTINHAHNIIVYDLNKSFGLTDEAVGPSPAAHPFIHTHQGNMPRLFSALLYALGARSVQLQIAISTFTVGLATILLAFGFWKRQAGPLFAMLACLFLITDYLFFAQWQVNTYRVWIVFLVFSTLWTVLGVGGGSRPILWSGLTLLNAMLIAYGELMFAVFALSSGAFFAAWEFRRRPKLLAVWIGAAGVGALMALTVLVGQLVAYYGVRDLLTDISYTFLSRGTIVADGLHDRVRDFYASHNIVFFRNFAPPFADRSLAGLTRALGTHIELLTPAIFLMSAISLLGAGFSLFAGWLERRFALNRSCNSLLMLMAYSSLAVSAALFLFTLFVGDPLFDFVTERAFSIPRLAFKIVLSVAFGAACATLFSRSWRRGSWSAAIRLGLGALLLALVAIFLKFHTQIYTLSHSGPISVLWGDQLLVPSALFITNLAVVSCALAWIWRISFPYPAVGSAPEFLRRIGPFLFSGLLAYVVAYMFSPGYSYSGYLWRGETFLVAHIDAAIAAALYMMVAMAIETRRRRVALSLPAPLNRVLWRQTLGLRTVVVLASFGAAYLAAQWLYTQARYVYFIPPDQYAFVRTLAEQRFRGSSVASNTYAVPFAWLTGSWGYIDPVFGRSPPSPRSHPDPRLIWLADRGTNLDYDVPDLFVCYANINLTTIAAILAGKDASNPCRPERVFLASGAYSYQLIAWGPALHSLGASWGIYRLTWPKRSQDE